MNILSTRCVRSLAILGMIAGVLLVGGQANADSLGFSLSTEVSPGSAPDDLSVVVMDNETQKPLADASITLADSLNDDHSGQRHLTGFDGASRFKSALSRAHALTVTKEGFSAISLLGVKSAQVTIYLKPLPHSVAEPVAVDPVLATGTLLGWPESLGGDVVNAGLVFRTLNAFDLLHFDTDSLISPLKDKIEVLGSHDIPSNLVLPEQDISVFLASFTLNKPVFRLPVERGHAMSLAGVQGTIAVRELMSIVQGGGKISLELLNKLKFTRAGLTGEFTPATDLHTDVTTDLDLHTQHQVTVNAPPFKADVLVAAATDMNGDRGTLLPTDIKLAVSSANPGQIKAVSLSASDASVGKAHDVLTIAMGEKGRRISGIVSDSAGASVKPGEFLAVDELADAPALPESLALHAMASGLSAAIYESSKTALWYVYALPESGTTPITASRLAGLDKVTAFSVIQLEFGQGFDGKTLDGQGVMRKLQRFARATAKVVKP
jgi:hypothetical protein